MQNGHPLSHPCRWGLLGLSQIARNYVAPALSTLRSNAITAVATTSPAKALAWSQAYPRTQVHSSYDDLINDPTVDAIYISLPHLLHPSWAIKAIKAGKHVLIEKPLALDLAQAQKVYQAAQDAQVYVLEGFMWQQQARAQQIWQFLYGHQPIPGYPALPELGPLKSIVGAYSFYEPNIENPSAAAHDFRLQDGLGGGALSDIGCYLINLAQLFIPAPIEEIFATEELFPGTKAVDQSTSFILRWPQGTGIFTCRYDTGFVGQWVDLIFRHGKIHWPWPFNPPAHPQYQIYTEQQTDPITISVPEANNFAEEFKYFEQNLAQKTLTYPFGQKDDHYCRQAALLAAVKTAAQTAQRVLI